MIALSTLRTVHLALVVASLLAAPSSADQARELIGRLEEHVARCQDFQYDICSYAVSYTHLSLPTIGSV